MKRIENIIPKGWLPSLRWEEFSRYGKGSENQIAVRIGHINPEDRADPKLITAGVLSSSPNKTVYAVGSRTLKGSTGKFFETMGEMAGMGMMRGWTPAKVQKLREEINEGNPEKYDYNAVISITQLLDKKTAQQYLENIANLPTKGFMDSPVPGMDNTTFKDVFENPVVKAQLTDKQFQEIKKVSQEIKAQAKETSKTGIGYQKGKFQGYNAIYIQGPAGKGFCQGIRIKNYLFNSNLLEILETLISGNTVCDSLTKFKTKTYTEKYRGETYTQKEIIPVKSTYVKEGYLHKEEVEKILRTIFANIEKQ